MTSAPSTVVSSVLYFLTSLASTKGAGSSGGGAACLAGLEVGVFGGCDAAGAVHGVHLAVVYDLGVAVVRREERVPREARHVACHKDVHASLRRDSRNSARVPALPASLDGANL